jgi:Cys-tRNA(Pro)/Cys-tRNA(Cys) deacylase
VSRTRATQALDSLGVLYELLEFEAHDHTAAEAARRLQIATSQVFKTLVVRADSGQVVLALVPGDHELNLRALARAAGVKRVEMVDASELVRLVGYIKGAVSPLGTKRSYPTYIDRSALDHARISVSAGVRGLQIWIDPQNLIRAAGAKVEALTLT